MDSNVNLFNLDKNTTNFLKGLAIIFVILGHMDYLYRSGSWGVNLFLVMSGYGIFSSYVKNNNKNYFIKKFKKVYIPYFLTACIPLIYYIFSGAYSRKVILFSLLGIDFNFIYDKTMWYISFIFAEYIIFYITCLISKLIFKTTVKQYILILILNIAGGYLLSYLSDHYAIWDMNAGVKLYTYTFSFGILIALLSKIKINADIKTAILSIISAILLISVICMYKNVESNTQYIYYAATIPLILIFGIELKIIKPDNKYINWFGKYSYEIYLWEAFFLCNRMTWFSSIKYTLLIDILTIILICTVSFYYKALVIDNAVRLLSLKKAETKLHSQNTQKIEV